MKIERIRLVNFMRYDEVELELHKGFNAIVGQTDAGKSTLIRALTWVFYNKPSGMEMCRAGTDETSVVISTDTGVEVERYRSKKRNAYRVDETWYDAIATGVPEPVQAALGIHLAELGPKVIEMLNVSRQMDGPFLLSASGGDAAKILGNLSGITKIDTGLASLRPDISNAKKQIDVAMKLQRNYDASIGEFAGLDQEILALEKIGKDLSMANTIGVRLVALRDVSTRMQEYNMVVATVDKEIAEERTILALQPQLYAAQALMARIEQLYDLESQMAQSNRTGIELDTHIASTTELLKQLDTAYHSVLHDAGQCPTCGAITNVEA